jgi:uncharacterized repeat protein (TIGR03803 family)
MVNLSVTPALMALCLWTASLRAQPLILAEPQPQTVPPGFNASFFVANSGALAQQWYVNNKLLPGATNGLLDIIAVQATNTGTYVDVLSNSTGISTSAPVSLVISNIPTQASNMNFATLASFNQFVTGSFPQAGVTQGSDGYLYGTTLRGGTNNITTGGDGTAFKLGTNGSFIWSYSFTGKNDGQAPAAGLVQTPDGNLYGVSETGGQFGFGTVFRVTTNGVLTPIYPFLGDDSVGGIPEGQLCVGSDGYLYGSTTTNGTGAQGGAIFKMNTNGLTNWYFVLTTNTGLVPLAGLVQGTNGVFYGTTSTSGSNGFGTVLAVSPAGSVTPLYAFNTNVGINPNAPLTQGPDGQFYGTTTGGGTFGLGTIFKITTNGALTVLYSFDNTNGYLPEGGLTLASDGNFYGTATDGGIGDALNPTNLFRVTFGTVFQFTPGGVLTTLLSFNGNYDGASPHALLCQGQDGGIYGTTANGGVNNLANEAGGDGTVFRLQLAPQIVWPAPAAITYGTALSGAQLDAAAKWNSSVVTGAFAYSPPLNTVLSSGSDQTLSVSFAPVDPIYTNVTATVQINVLQAPLALTAGNVTKNYGQTISFAGTEFTTTGLVNGDTVTGASLSSLGAPPTAAVSGSPYPIVITNALGDAGLTNYIITYTNGSLTIKPASLTITADNTNKISGQTITFAGTEFTSAGLQNSETIGSVTLTSAGAAASAAVGDYNIVPSAPAGGTFAQGNYTDAFFNGTLAVAGRPPVAVTRTGTNFVLTFSTLANELYQIESVTNLPSTNWSPLGGPIGGTGLSISVTNPLPALPKTFYRLQIQF